MCHFPSEMCHIPTKKKLGLMALGFSSNLQLSTKSEKCNTNQHTNISTIQRVHDVAKQRVHAFLIDSLFFIKIKYRFTKPTDRTTYQRNWNASSF